MSLSPVVRRTLLFLALVLLLGFAWAGLSGGFSQLSQSSTIGRKVQTFSQLAYGAFSLLSVVTTFVGRRWQAAMLIGWTLSVTVAAGLASIVWGGTSVAIGVLSGGAALLTGLGIIWPLRVGARGLTRTRTARLLLNPPRPPPSQLDSGRRSPVDYLPAASFRFELGAEARRTRLSENSVTSR